MFRVYGLHGDDGVIRYVGVTVKSLSARLTGHRIDAKTLETRKARWMRKTGGAVRAVLLASVPTQVEAYQLERAYIETYRAVGINLVNATDGGEGVCGLTEDARRKIRASWMNPKARAARVKKIAAKRRGHHASDEAKANMRAAHLGKSRSATATAKQRAKMIGRKKPAGFDGGWSGLTPEKREQRLSGLARSWEKRRRARVQGVRPVGQDTGAIDMAVSASE